ncbi:hypothetical protein RB195_021146 [Necator americanus]|uniref:Ground-like domain protein n=1 Tax=Necator americanus TaxID=51031 RepID=A0ABR1E9J9_NECAM
MLTGLFRYCLCLILGTQLVYSNVNDSISTSSHQQRNITSQLTIQRTKRAATAQCSSTSSNNVAHSLVSSICCDSMIPLFIDNQLSTNDGLGSITRAVQQRIQSRFNRSFEVVISESDFVINTYYSGPRQCKFETDRYFVALYETPTQYDVADTTVENFLASIDSRDPLGWKQAPLAEQNEALPVDGTTNIESGSDSDVASLSGSSAASSGSAASNSATSSAQPGSGGACSWRGSAADANVPYTFTSEECCDVRLNIIMRDAATRSRDTPHLGDSAKYIQRRIQLEYGLSFEVIMSTANFAVSSYYHGQSSCKIHDGNFYYVAYATPVQYDPFNIAQEDYLASTDAEEPLGSTRYTSLRGDRPDIRIEPSAGEDISIQPAVLQARALIYEGAGGAGRTSNREPEVSVSDIFTDDSDLATASVINGFNVGGNRTLGTVPSEESRGLPPGTHCDKGNKTGDKCCSGLLFETMTDAFYELSSSPQFAFASAGNIASLIQKRAQLRFDQSFEVVVSSGDFALASHGVGDQTCKYKERGFTAIAYTTPTQYDITQTAAESYYASISSRDNLGATQTSLPGQRPFHTPLQLYGEGAGAGLPVGSHCGDARSGSKCCSAPLFNVMQSSYESLINRDNFDPYNLRLIARTIQYNAEEQLQMSVEAFISTDDFAISSAYEGNEICKYRIDRYYIMAYATPVQYPIHSQIYDDTGPAIPINCPGELDGLDGAVCCDGTIQYEMTRAIDEALQNQPEGQRSNDALATTISRNIERRFGRTFETIVSRSDFTWQTNIYNQNTCKIDCLGYHTLIVQSSNAPPPLSDFFDPAPLPIAPLEVPFQAVPPVQAPPPVPQAPVGAAPPAFVFGPPAVAAPPVAPPAFAPPAAVPVFYGGGGGGGGGGGACFSTDTWVTTPNGKKRMDQLKVGDFVLTANLTAVYYAPMSLWIHREPDLVTKFITIMTDYGKMLALTPRHLIFRNKCDEYYEERVYALPPNSQAVYAEELEVGDCVYLFYRTGFRQQKLQDISITQRRGVFSPLTPNGRIIVNDMLASCYSDVNEATLQTTYFSVLNSIRKRVVTWFGSWIDEKVDIPFGSGFSMELLRLIVPYNSFTSVCLASGFHIGVMLVLIQLLQRFLRFPRRFEKAKPFTLHCSLLLLVLAYAFAGGFIFNRLEAEAFQRHQDESRQEKLRCVLEVIAKLSPLSLENPWRNATATKISNCYEPERDERSEWSFVTATLYGFGIVTTLGYNRIAPITYAGRLFCIVYGICGIPITMIIIANVGQYLNNFAGDSRRKLEAYRTQRRMSRASLSGKQYKLQLQEKEKRLCVVHFSMPFFAIRKRAEVSQWFRVDS